MTVSNSTIKSLSILILILIIFVVVVVIVIFVIILVFLIVALNTKSVIILKVFQRLDCRFVARRYKSILNWL